MDVTGTAIWLGTYTGDGEGTGRGIYRVPVVDGALGAPALAAPVSSPSFLAAHPRLPVLYAIEEFTGRIRAYSVADDGSLATLGEPRDAGDTVCHVAVDPTGRHAIASCYGSGAVVEFGLDAVGALGSRNEGAAARDPYPRADAEDPWNGGARVSRAHMGLMLPGGRVLTTDIGYDLARVWWLDAERGLELDHEVALPEGTGPRHAVRHPSGAVFIVTEYSTVVHVLAPDASGRFALAATAPVLAGGAAAGDYGAHITLSPDGSRAHVTVRGANRVATLGVSADGTSLSPLGDVDCGGDWPRDHLQLGDRLYVANQRSATVSVLRIDADGCAGEVLAVIPAGTPACVVAA